MAQAVLLKVRLLTPALFISKYTWLGRALCVGGGWVGAVDAYGLPMKVEWHLFDKNVATPGPALVG